MKKIFSIFLVLISIWVSTCFAADGTDSTNLTLTIDHLLSFVENSKCRFIRNNQEHSAEEAAAHMRRKYQYFRDRIKTPEDFIRLAATKSLMTNEPYRVKLEDGNVIKSAAWLLKALEEYREGQKN